MSQTAVLVWLSAGPLLPTFSADLHAFAESRLVRLQAPRENAASFHASAYPPDAVLEIENALEEARNARASLEPARALVALERARRSLHEHPELPQAAWLMAEDLELAADVESSSPDGARTAARLRAHAASLAGARATPYEGAGAGTVFDAESVVLTVRGVEGGDELEWDASDARSPLSTTSGEHHARVFRRGRLLWAGWVSVSRSEVEVRLPAPETVACSADDLADARFEDNRALASPTARCDSYVIARAHGHSGIDAALCERNACGELVTWPNARAVTKAPPEARVWPYAAVVSASALALSGVLLWRLGVFDRADPGSRSVWVYNPSAQTLGLRF